MNAGYGGQVLVSQAVVDLLHGRLPADVSLRNLGTVRLKGLTASEGVHQLVHPALRQNFPALRELEATPNNLPQQITSFIGRQREREDAKVLLTRTRLLTLLGMGGLGKTRLSLQIAADVMDGYPDGVWFVDLAPITEPSFVASEAAQVLGGLYRHFVHESDFLGQPVGSQHDAKSLEDDRHAVLVVLAPRRDPRSPVS